MPQRIDDYIAKPQKPAPPDDGQKRAEPVQRAVCKGWLRAQRFAMSVWVVVHTQDTVTDDPDSGYWQYFCGACWAEKQGLGNEADGIMAIRQSQIRGSTKRAKDYTENKKFVQENIVFGCSSTISADNVSNRQVKRLAVVPRETLMKLFAPWGQWIRLVGARLEQTHELVVKHEKLVKRIGEAMCNSSLASELDEILQEVDSVEEQLSGLERPLAFDQHDVPTQQDFLIAVEYMDEYINMGNNMYFRAWYTCSCGAAISSKSWRTLYTEFTADASSPSGVLARGTYRTGQRWYCLCCPRRYRPKMGMVTEMRLGSTLYWSLASIPPKDVQCIKGLSVEAEIQLSGQAVTPEQLYRSITQYRPVTGSILRPATLSDLHDPTAPDAGEVVNMVAMITPEGRSVLEGTPMFPWMQMFNWA